MEARLELIAIPVSDPDRAKAFYTDKLGFNCDHDHKMGEELRFIQLTPRGSSCSIAFGVGISKLEPGKAQGMLLVVDDIDAAYAELTELGVEISEPQDMGWGAVHADFTDPDGNAWQLQMPTGAKPQSSS